MFGVHADLEIRPDNQMFTVRKGLYGLHNVSIAPFEAEAMVVVLRKARWEPSEERRNIVFRGREVVVKGHPDRDALDLSVLGFQEVARIGHVRGEYGYVAVCRVNFYQLHLVRLASRFIET